MSVFKRRKKGQLDTDPGEEDVDAVDSADAAETADAGGEDGDEEPAAPAAPGRPQGPWDAADAPERDLPRLDLGALLIPVSEGLEVRVDVNAQRQVVTATLVKGGSTLQLSVFAAPRTDGIWDEVREEIATALSESGGRATATPGPFGTELQAAVPAQDPDRGAVLTPARFLGVDGPRWFVRGVITGAAATDPAQAGDLEAAFRDVVVVRGDEAMAVRDPLPLRLPAEVEAGAQPETGEAGAPPATDAHEQGDESSPPAPDSDALTMPERGPEITETR